MSDIDATNCFISRCDCGGLTFAAVDTPERRKDNAKEVAALIRDGRRVENLSVTEVRGARWCFGECKGKRK